MQAHEFWQEILPPTGDPKPTHYDTAYPATFDDGSRLLLPIRALPGGQNAVASLIINQASFAVLAALAADLAAKLRPFAPDLIIGLPTLGLTLAAAVAAALGHPRYIPLGTSRKFWYDDGLSVSLTSITSPTQPKTLYLDPRLRPLLEGRRLALLDDVISTGASMAAGVSLLSLCNATPIACATAMLQTKTWQTRLSTPIVSVLSTPLLSKTPDGLWTN